MWPTWRTSKQPLAKAMLFPCRCNSCVSCTSCVSLRIGAFMVVRLSGCRLLQLFIALDGMPQLVIRDGGRAHLHDYDPSAVVGQLGRLGVGRAGGQSQSERGDDRVAGAGDVGNLIGA